jgi:hypothetical protein
LNLDRRSTVAFCSKLFNPFFSVSSNNFMKSLIFFPSSVMLCPESSGKFAVQAFDDEDTLPFPLLAPSSSALFIDAPLNLGGRLVKLLLNLIELGRGEPEDGCPDWDESIGVGIDMRCGSGPPAPAEGRDRIGMEVPDDTLLPTTPAPGDDATEPVLNGLNETEERRAAFSIDRSDKFDSRAER